MVASLLLLLPVRAFAADVTAATPLIPLNITQVSAVTIHSAIGGFGSGAVSDIVIRERDGEFVRDDGSRVPRASVAALLDAMSAPAVPFAAVAKSEFERISLAAHLRDAETVYLGSAMRLSKVRSDFERQYVEAELFEAWLKPQFSEFMNDYYPAVEVTVAERNRRITASSRSQWPFMLPILVSEGSIGIKTFSPALSVAIGALM